ncbi:MAG: GerMN domain-containing protein, partial [Ilumatobacteraceae bacterium]
GCAVAFDEAPRDIDLGAADVAQDASPSVQAAEGTGRIYLTSTSGAGQATTLRSVARDAGDDVDALLAALLAGPNANEFADGYRSALPAGLAVNGRQRRGNLVVIDLSDDIQDLSGTALILALAQIVYTLTGLTNVDRVLVTVDGEQPQWPDGTGQLQSDPLTVYDYPGLEPSAQPAYPAVPSQ